MIMEAFITEIEARRKVASILGTASERKALRLALGLSLAEVAAQTGLSVPSIRRRESEAWKRQHRSLESEEGWRYVCFVAACKGVAL
jgi:DNA-directed RNA polymerase specialized sigma24 family protein